MRERDVEKYLVERVERLQGRADKFVSPGLNGVPDRLVKLPLWPAFLVELKKPGEPLKTHQVEVHKDMRRAGWDIYVVDTIEGVDDLLKGYLL